MIDGPRDGAALPSARVVLVGELAVHKISVSPFGSGWWSFNPCVHYDVVDDAWRCVFRCANYSLPGGVIQLAAANKRGRAESRNVVARLDPRTLAVTSLREIAELDGGRRSEECTSLGFEDVRMFRTKVDGLLGIATCLQLNLQCPSRPEMVLLRLSDDLDVVGATPIRGPWSVRPQKNWSPFEGTTWPRFLYSIERGVVMSPGGPVAGEPMPAATTPPEIPARPIPVAHPRRSGAEVKIAGTTVRGQGPSQPIRGTAAQPGSTELRGGSPLTQIAVDRWLGIAHEMRLVGNDRKKLYWHTLYVVDDEGQLRERSEPFKLSPNHGIEFAAGLAIDPSGRVAISFGTDDHDSWIGVTSLAAIERALRPIGSRARPVNAPG